MKTRIATLFLLGVAWGCGGNTRPAVGDAGTTDKIVDQPSRVQLALSANDQSEQARLTGRWLGCPDSRPAI